MDIRPFCQKQFRYVLLACACRGMQDGFPSVTILGVDVRTFSDQQLHYVLVALDRKSVV